MLLPRECKRWLSSNTKTLHKPFCFGKVFWVSCLQHVHHVPWWLPSLSSSCFSSSSARHSSVAVPAGTSLPVGCKALSDRRRARGLCQRLLVLLNSHVTEYGIISPQLPAGGFVSFTVGYHVNTLSLKHLCQLSHPCDAHHLTSTVGRCTLHTTVHQAACPQCVWLSHAWLPSHFGCGVAFSILPLPSPQLVSLAGSGEVIYGVPHAPGESGSLCFREIHRTGRGGHCVAGLLTLPAY